MPKTKISPNRFWNNVFGIKKRPNEPYSSGGQAPTITVTFPSSVLLKRRGLVSERCFDVSADGMVSAPDEGVLASCSARFEFVGASSGIAFSFSMAPITNCIEPAERVTATARATLQREFQNID